MLLSPFHSSSSSYWRFLDVLLTVVLVSLSCSVYICHGSCNEQDRNSLSSFNLSISTQPPLYWSLSFDCYSWEGVGRDESGRVNSLFLPSKGLVGTISPFIVNLTSLTQLNLSRNRFSGPIPDEFFTALNRLVFIYISHNHLTGQLSDSDKLMTLNLERFGVSDNSFSGSIPSSVCRFSPSIVHLDFSNNDFVGPISDGFGQCHNLLRLRAGFNNFSGSIPCDIYMVSSLQELYLPANKLFGVIDGSIVNLINLRNLSLYGNELTGTIPRDMGRLSKMEQLWLHVN
ncbi:tyrosine-sulfated glycopeptide receptor 1 [Olea europaea subsp. europaea]|uniref:Tyrosine-sulfated glycopeptide receptor 1 n=1 Tax=Olea europaea subsp. europaea TaxID=158383 RepID=A0A8S0S8F2_OLEEU|nr:tyrosine-sulfated glycopeptide receptor 1 [Olea europaea subsp. europaea]